MNSIALTRSIMPPDGHFCPAKQDSVHQATSLDIQTLQTKAQQALPFGFTVMEINGSGSAVNIYAWNGTGWEDDVNGGLVTAATSITGTVHFRNPATYDVEFVW